MDPNVTKNILPKENLGTLDSPLVEMVMSQAPVQDCQSRSPTCETFPPSPSPPPSPPSIQDQKEFSSCGALLLSQKLRNLELQTRGTETLDPSCLLTPPNTPQTVMEPEMVKAYQEKWVKGDNVTLPWFSGVDAYDEGTVKMHFYLCSVVKNNPKLVHQ